MRKGEPVSQILYRHKYTLNSDCKDKALNLRVKVTIGFRLQAFTIILKYKKKLKEICKCIFKGFVKRLQCRFQNQFYEYPKNLRCKPFLSPVFDLCCSFCHTQRAVLYKSRARISCRCYAGLSFLEQPTLPDKKTPPEISYRANMYLSKALIMSAHTYMRYSCQ